MNRFDLRFLDELKTTATVSQQREEETVSESKARLGAATGSTKDLCIESVRLRVEDHEFGSIRSAMAIAKLLGHDEIVALMEDDKVPPATAAASLATKALAPAMNGDEVAQALRLRRQTQQ
ncbi:hypothetical protein [Edaphobacter flagellatus]|uniref:hypothetical protein n=1 Tax=Edaphobacter flagellatus TaxID=1933044 RepID=UPI0021B1FA0F|nr:hypothetical protein [Edaphobacter flagellatus]